MSKKTQKSLYLTLAIIGLLVVGVFIYYNFVDFNTLQTSFVDSNLGNVEVSIQRFNFMAPVEQVVYATETISEVNKPVTLTIDLTPEEYSDFRTAILFIAYDETKMEITNDPDYYSGDRQYSVITSLDNFISDSGTYKLSTTFIPDKVGYYTAVAIIDKSNNYIYSYPSNQVHVVVSIEQKTKNVLLYGLALGVIILFLIIIFLVIKRIRYKRTRRYR